jgi:hypothetical protein
MNIQTLHLCNINQKVNLDCFNELVSTQDVIVFYGRCIDEDKQQILQKLFLQNPIYFLISENPELSNIDYNGWLKLIKCCHKTLTWQ